MTLRPAALVSVAVAGLMIGSMTPATAKRAPSAGESARASAFALDVDVDLLSAVPVDVGPLARVRVSGEAVPQLEDVVDIEIPSIVAALLLATRADTGLKELSAEASAKVVDLQLEVAGSLLVKVLESSCNITRDTVEVSSDVVFADGSVLDITADLVGLVARPNSRLDIPAVGYLVLNEQKIEKRLSSRSGRVDVTVNALHLHLDGLLGEGDIIASQSKCSLRGAGVGKDLKIVSSTNGSDTSDDVDESHGEGLLGGVLDGGLLNATRLLGGGSLLGGAGLGGLL